MKDILAFLDAMQAVFGRLDFVPVADGKIHRFHIPGDRPGSKNGAYQLFPDGIVSGWYGTWKDAGSWHNWSSRQPATPLEVEQMRQRSEQAKQQREAERKNNQHEAAKKALRLWRDAFPADANHPYLVTKGCQPHDLRQIGHMLLAPLYHEGLLVNLQRIFPNGSKWFLEGGMVGGCYSPLGTIKPDQPLYICEGWATGATLHEETGAAVACAMSASNLLLVGRYLRQRYPDAVLIVAGDDDRQPPKNPGRTYAQEAARELNCGVVFPPWTGAELLNLTDFNDLRQWRRHHE
jgi:putative DNA primase/helicase